ncbi:MAG: hypothetical protein ACT4QD_00125 [Acidobacteriota bacterium]
MTALLVAGALGLVAWVAPAPWYLTDRTEYEQVGREWLIPSCSSLHCFRKLVPIAIEQLPGPSIVKWKTYAVVSNALAAVAVARLALAFGLSPWAAWMSLLLSAFGFGSLFTLFDPHSADPLMFLLGPALAGMLVVRPTRPGEAIAASARPRTGRAAAIAAVGVFAKEFAAAPLWIGAGVCWMTGRRGLLARAAVAGLVVTTIWVVYQLTLITAFDYSYGGNPSSRIFEGGYIAHWVSELGPRAALTSIVMNYGPLLVLVPAGFLLAPAELRRWALASVPALAAFAYVQQPDRAIWNMHFVSVPLAALALTRLPTSAAAVLVACYAAANLRVGAQLTFVPASRYALGAAILLALVAAWRVWRDRAPRDAGRNAVRPGRDVSLTGAERWRLRSATALSAAILLVSAVVGLDATVHRRTEEINGVNKWGYRGPVAKPKQPDERRIAVLGGTFTFGPGVTWIQSFPACLERFARQGWRQLFVGDRVSVINLAAPGDSIGTFVDTLQDYDYLAPDVVVMVAEPQRSPGVPASWRRRSAVFRATGYLPLLPDGLIGDLPPVPAPVTVRDESIDAASESACDGYCDVVADAVSFALRSAGRVLVVSPPPAAPGDRVRQRQVEASLASRFGDEPRVGYLSLGHVVDLADASISPDGVRLSLAAHEQVAEALIDPVLKMLRTASVQR